VIVEEPSAEKALRHLLPKIVGRKTKFKIINMRGKGRLLRKLPAGLKAYRERIRREKDLRILVLVDRDADDCKKLKQRLESAARDAGLPTKTRPAGDGYFLVVNRIVVEELESWFIGDTAALRKAFPRLSDKFPANFATPDNGGTGERLHRFLRKQGIYRQHYAKIEAADKIAAHMDPQCNRSRSFQHFRRAVESLL
jgi:hypothetical protein